jgi:hypothetical protein
LKGKRCADASERHRVHSARFRGHGKPARHEISWRSLNHIVSLLIRSMASSLRLGDANRINTEGSDEF